MKGVYFHSASFKIKSIIIINQYIYYCVSGLIDLDFVVCSDTGLLFYNIGENSLSSNE